jgi:TolB-like protein
MRLSQWACLVLVTAFTFSGCALLQQMTASRPKPRVPVVLVLPFKCENSEVAGKITQGFVENLTGKKAEGMDLAKYELVLASNALLMKGTTDWVEINDSSSTFFSRLSRDEDLRRAVVRQAGVDYVVGGSAMEQKWSEIDMANIATAESAEFIFFDLRAGKMECYGEFKQGIFEIVAPDRIGSKLASQVIKYLKEDQATIKDVRQLRKERAE